MDTSLPRPRWRLTADYLVFDWLNIGVEYNVSAREFNPRGNATVLREGRWWPMINLGTSSDRIGSPTGMQAYFATFAKTIPGTPFAPYVSVNYSEWDEGLNFPFGMNVQLSPRWSVLPMYDGHRSHAMLNYSSGEGWGVSALWVWLERAGVAVTVGI